jgi:two-component system nitrogen regulation sensor histidine kinase NtrY
LLSLKSFIRSTSLAVGSSGILLGLALSWWAASRVTRPLQALTANVQRVAAGEWDVRAPVRSRDEIGRLARDFNTMTHQLVEQKQRIIQTERVAAWRELARRLAHELKNPLFPLQITVENLQRVRERSPEEFEDVFRESTATLLSELDNLKAIIGRFSDFAKMPAPQLETVDVNEIARDVVRLFAAQFVTPGKPPIAARLDLADGLPKVDADPEQLRRALRNLVLNAMDAMPNGGDLTVRTRAANGHVAIEVADSGEGLTKEECERLFTPYYTTKRHGTGLGLAIVQSVVADHHGSIAVESEPGKGASFRIELQAAREPGVGSPESGGRRSNGEPHTAGG